MSVNDIATIAPVEGGKSVTTAGTPVQLTAAKCNGIILTARKGNTGSIAYGYDNSVRATAGSEVGAILTPGSSVFLPVVDASQIWIDASVNGEGIGYTTQIK